MSLQVLVLTTETSHHIHFVRQLVEVGYQVSVLSEKQVTSSRASFREIEARRQEYEDGRWFPDGSLRLADLCPTVPTTSVNSAEGLLALDQLSPDVAITFGTRWIRKDALQLLPFERWNLHGGDPQKYRGLDSHLWALYHKDHCALTSTIHVLDPDLDAGDIIAGSQIDLGSAPELYMLRRANTDLVVDLVLGSLAHLEAVGRVPRMPQALNGRYYSSLPSVLWDKCTESYAAAVQIQMHRS